MLLALLDALTAGLGPGTRGPASPGSAPAGVVGHRVESAPNGPATPGAPGHRAASAVGHTV